MKIVNAVAFLAAFATLAACDEEVATPATPAVLDPAVIRMDGKDARNDPALLAQMQRAYQSCWLAHNGKTNGIIPCLAPKGYVLVPGHLAEATLNYYRNNPQRVPKG